MQKESYDIEEVKRYFRYYLFSAHKKLWTFNDVSDKDFFTKERRLANYFIGAGALLFSIIFIYYKEYSLASGFFEIMRKSDFIAISVIGSYLSMIQGAILRYLLNIYKKLEDYLKTKEVLISFGKKFGKVVTTDSKSIGIDPMNIDEIYTTLKQITLTTKLIKGPILGFTKAKSSLFGKEAKETLENFTAIEIEWIKGYANEFGKLLKRWMAVHQSELTEYQKNNLLSKNEEVYTLASSRLSSHIENLEKVRAKL